MSTSALQVARTGLDAQDTNRTDLYQPTKFENADNASGISLDGNTFKLISGDSSDPQAAAQLGAGQRGLPLPAPDLARARA